MRNVLYITAKREQAEALGTVYYRHGRSR
ncbi:MAG TPA: hypothetical protein VHJ59_09710 [Nitrososphaera sp.]|nr:hypothetical protein [Nitrososphaera sp.]